MKTVIDLVAGARPNFIKLAPVLRAIEHHTQLEPRLVHTGQHFDRSMSDSFFEQLEIPAPAINLEVGSGRHGEQTARILERYEAHLLAKAPAATVVFGDVNSTVGCALAAVKLGVPTVHVESGLRSFDRSMPEEINRIVTDSIAELHLVTEASGVENLLREGVAKEKIRLVGNVMIDSLQAMLPAARALGVPRAMNLEPGGYGLVTLHRPSNVDDGATLGRLLELLHELARELPLVFPMHPRTRASAERSGLDHLLVNGDTGLVFRPPLPYLEAVGLMADAAVVLSDSGGMQEESSVLGVPCLTLRDNTERPVTLELGTSELVGNSSERIRDAFDRALGGAWRQVGEIPLWDGKAAERVAHEIAIWLESRPPMGRD